MRGVLVAVSLVALGTLAGMTACTFAEVTFAEADPTDGGAGEGGVQPDGPGSEGSGDDAADASEIKIDGESPDALIAKDSGGPPIDASGCPANECDCDKDGFKNTLKAGCSGGELDCDDSDPRAKPGQIYLEDPATTQQRGDWNCVNGAEPLYATSVKCEGRLLGLGCSDVFGFEDTPQCGEMGSFIRCKRASLLALDCSVDTRAAVKQPCK